MYKIADGVALNALTEFFSSALLVRSRDHNLRNSVFKLNVPLLKTLYFKMSISFHDVKLRKDLPI